MALARDKAETLTWLECYGVQRAGGRSPRESLQGVQQPVRAAEWMAITSAAGELAAQRSELGFRAAAALASYVPVVGSLASLAFGWMGDLGRAIAENSRPRCDKGCAVPRSHERHNLVGLDPAPALSTVPSSIHDGSYIRDFWHDGLVAEGPGARGTLEATGRILGANGYVTKSGSDRAFMQEGGRHVHKLYGSDFNRTMYDRYNPGIPYGRGGADSPSGTWLRRAWIARTQLKWMEYKFPCTDILCYVAVSVQFSRAVSAQLRQSGVASGGDEIRNIKLRIMRHRGSMHYASLYHMQKDFWDLGHRIGLEQTTRLLNAAGNEGAASHLRDHWSDTGLGAYGYRPSSKGLPWTSAYQGMSWLGLKRALPPMILQAGSVPQAPSRTTGPRMIRAPVSRMHRVSTAGMSPSAASKVRAAIARQEQEREGSGLGTALVVGGGLATALAAYLYTRKG